MNKKKCMACCIYCDTQKYKPYCLKCWKNIRNDRYSSFLTPNKRKLCNEKSTLYADYPNIISQEICRLRKKYSFLDLINHSVLKDNCQQCDVNLGSEYIWWYGKHKKICPTCIENIINGDIDATKLRARQGNLRKKSHRNKIKNDEIDFLSDSD